MEKNEDNDETNKENNNNEILDNKRYKIEIIKDNLLYNEIIHKVIIIGDSSVGKTSLSLRITTDCFEDCRKATIGFDIFNYVAKINDKVIKLQIWDTCGLEEFSSCGLSLYTNASLAIIVYAINDIKSFEHIESWVNLVKTNAKPETLLFIVGNKLDLSDKRKVQKEEVEKLKENNLFNYFTETSAKENKFVYELFEQAIIQLYEQNLDYQNTEIEQRIDFSKRKDSVRLKKSKKESSNKKSKTCCK